MKKVTLYLPDYYDRVLVVTAIGDCHGTGINVTPRGFDLENGTTLMLEADSNLKVEWTQLKEGTE